MAQSVAAADEADDTSPTPRRAIVTSLLLVTALAAGLVGLLINLSTLGASVELRSEPIGSFATFGLLATSAIVGAILRRRRAVDPFGSLFLALATAGAIASALYGLALAQRLPGGDPEFGQLLAWLDVWVSIGTWTYLIAALVIRFPTGHLETPADARLMRLAAVVSVVSAALLAVRPGPNLFIPSLSSPVVLPAALVAPVTLGSVGALILGLMVVAAAVLRMVDRYRHATLIGRLQLRWFAYAGVLTLAGGLLFVIVGVLGAAENRLLREVTYAAFVLSACSLPIAVLQAITRHRLYDIDRIIGRTFIYGMLTAILAGLYAASIRLFNALFVGLTGQGDEAALVLTTLVLTTTFTPIKSRLEKVAEKRFKSVEALEPNAADRATTQALDARTRAAAAPGHEAMASLDEQVEAAVRRVLPEVLEESRRRQSR